MSEWISVKDNLPTIEEFNASDTVLISFKRICKHCKNLDPKFFVALAWLGMVGEDDDPLSWNLHEPLEKDYFPCGAEEEIQVTHWMPLPEPPRDEE